MCTDNGTYVRNENGLLYTHCGFNAICKILGILLAIAVADKYQLLGGIDRKLLHAGAQIVKRGGSAALGADLNQMALVIHVHDRLDAECGAGNGGNGADASSAMQEEQIVDREQMRKV